METRDLFRMERWYIASWRATSNPTTLTEGGLAVFEGPVRPGLYAYATNVATNGVLPMGGKVPVRFQQAPYSPIDYNAGNTSLSLCCELLRLRLIACANVGVKLR